jgi:aliphatic sulfonates family ABC transporter substrate-binding protein
MNGTQTNQERSCTARMLVLLMGVIFALSSVSCSQDEKSNKNPVVTFAYQDRVADAASIIAVKKGFFADEGLDIRPMIFSSGPACTEALTYGNADFGTMGDTTAIVTASKGHGFRIIASHGGGEHRHRLLVARESGIKTLQDLEGKRIGVKKGTSTHGGLELLARQEGLDLRDEIIDISPRDQLLALAAGELDAIVASEPTPSKAEADGYGHELITLGGLGNSYPIFLLVNSKFAASHQDVVDKMLKGLQKATTFIAEHPEEAVAIQAAQSGLAPEVINKAMSYHHYGLSLDTSVQDSLMVTADFLLDIGKINHIPAWNEVIDPFYLQKLKEK